MFFASRSNFDAETALRQLEERMDSKLTIAKNEWISYLVTIEDVLDKIDHIVKRQGKRRKREETAPDNAVEPLEADPVSARVRERRQERGLPS